MLFKSAGVSNEEGEILKRKAIYSDSFVEPYENEKIARLANNGSYPPDLSLIVKARSGGADYLYSLLNGYKDFPEGFDASEGMYYNEYWVKLTKRHKVDNKLICKDGNIKYGKFKGLIVTGRGYKKDDGKGYITFVTIASNDGVYHDLVLYGYHKISKMICVSGYGKVKTDGFVTWIDVIKWKSEWLS